METIFVAGDIPNVEDGILDRPMFTEVRLNSVWRELRKVAPCDPQGGFDGGPIALAPGTTRAADQPTEANARPIEVLFQIDPPSSWAGVTQSSRRSMRPCPLLT